jgi:hypothetical protein
MEEVVGSIPTRSTKSQRFSRFFCLSSPAKVEPVVNGLPWFLDGFNAGGMGSVFEISMSFAKRISRNEGKRLSRIIPTSFRSPNQRSSEY